jgi:hypothetical protein
LRSSNQPDVGRGSRNMKSIVNGKIVTILGATGLALAMVIPAMTVTPPAKTPPTTKTPVPTKAKPNPAATPAIKTPQPSKVNPSPATITPATKTPLPTTTTPASTPTSTLTPPPLVLVPPLTTATLKNFTTLYSKVLEVEFTPRQQQKIQQRLTRDWMLNLGLRNTVSQTIAQETQIVKGTPAERTQLQTKLVANLRQQALDGDTDALWLVSFYDASSKNWLAPGQPPLTRMTTDSSADVLCFMLNEIMGKSVATPDLQLKNAIATKLTAEYPKIAASSKQEFAKLPANWLKFKENEWFRKGEDFREQMRVHWGQNLEAYVPEIREITKLRRDRLTKLKGDPTIKWSSLGSVQRQAALQTTEVDFQNSLRTLPQIKTVPVTTRIPLMQVAKAVGNSPMSYSSVKLKVK